jgi:uncharacterized phage protein gp47/JayE
MSIIDLVYVDGTGYHYPDYPTTLEFYKAEFRTIYGADVYLEADSQDGQWLAIVARSAYELMSLGASVYNSFSPSTAQGVGLSRQVKINGLRRRIATNSTADVEIVGQAGTTITNGVVEDTAGQKWDLPALVVIPIGGSITVTVTAQELGASQSAAGAINKISTPTLGWQTVTNPLAATPGVAVESDAELRIRQSISTAIPSLSVMEGIVGAVASLDGVSRLRGYENDTGATDANGQTEHSISLVVEGGDSQEIGDTIARKKTPGTGTYGTTTVTTYDQYGLPNDIDFFRPTIATIGIEITLTALTGYTSGYADLIKAALSEHIKALTIGDDVLINRLWCPANLPAPAGRTYNISLIRIKRDAGAFGTADIVLAFNEAADTEITDVSIIVL